MGALLCMASAIKSARLTPSKTAYICRSASAKAVSNKQLAVAAQQRSSARG
jgi:hypothetical protein